MTTKDKLIRKSIFSRGYFFGIAAAGSILAIVQYFSEFGLVGASFCFGYGIIRYIGLEFTAKKKDQEDVQKEIQYALDNGIVPKKE